MGPESPSAHQRLLGLTKGIGDARAENLHVAKSRRPICNIGLKIIGIGEIIHGVRKSGTRPSGDSGIAAYRTGCQTIYGRTTPKGVVPAIEC